MTPLDIWDAELTVEVRALAKSRILDGGNLATRVDLSRRTIKITLILVRALNPPEDLSEEETSILMGVSPGTLRKIRQEPALMRVVK
jgi:hypothetical protein